MLRYYQRYPNNYRIGQIEPQQEKFTINDLATAIKKVTPTLLIVGIATGAAFAIGAKLVDRIIFKSK